MLGTLPKKDVPRGIEDGSMVVFARGRHNIAVSNVVLVAVNHDTVFHYGQWVVRHAKQKTKCA